MTPELASEELLDDAHNAVDDGDEDVLGEDLEKTSLGAESGGERAAESLR